MLPYRKCHTWELSEKTVGLEIRGDSGCCMTAAAFCRVSAIETGGSGGASCQYGPLYRPFFPITSSREFFAAAAEVGDVAAKAAAVAADAAFCTSAEQAGTLVGTACAAIEPVAVGFHTTASLAAFQSPAGGVTAVQPVADVIRASAAQLSIAVSAALGPRLGSPSQTCHPILRKHRSFDSWFTPASACSFSFPTKETPSQQHVAAFAAGDTPATAAAANSTNDDDRDTGVLAVPVVKASGLRIATLEEPGAARAVWRAAESVTASDACFTRSAGASACARPAAGETTERDASAPPQSPEASTIFGGEPDCSSKSSCAGKMSMPCWVSDASGGSEGGALSNTANCQKQRDRPCETPNACVEGSSVAERVVEDIGLHRGSGELAPLQPQPSSGLQAEEAFAVPEAQPAALPSSSAAPVPHAQAASPLSAEATATAYLPPATGAALSATAAAGSDAGESQSCALLGISAAERSGTGSMKGVCDAGRGVGAAAEQRRNTYSNDSSGGPPSHNSSFSHRADSAPSIASGGSDLFSDEEQNKLNLFRRIGMKMPVAGLKHRSQRSAKMRSGSASAPAAYDSFASTCPHSLSFVSSHSLSLTYSQSVGGLPFVEAAANEVWWKTDSVDDSSRFNNLGDSRRISDLWQVATGSRMRSATYPSVRRSKEGQPQQQVREQTPPGCRARSATGSRSGWAFRCPGARAGVLQCKRELQQDQKDGKLLQEHEQASRELHEDCSSAVMQRVGELAPGERRKAAQLRQNASGQSPCEGWSSPVFNSRYCSTLSSELLSIRMRKHTSRADSIISGEHNRPDPARSVVVPPVVTGKQEGLRRTVSLEENGPGSSTCVPLRTGVRVRSTLSVAAGATAALLRTEEAAGRAAAEEGVPRVTDLAAPLEGLEATPPCGRRGEHEKAGATADGYMQVALLTSAGRNVQEFPGENAAGVLQQVDDVSSVDQNPFSALRRVDSGEGPTSERCDIYQAWEPRTGDSFSCGTAAAAPEGSEGPPAAADRGAAAGAEAADHPIIIHADRSGDVPVEVDSAPLVSTERSGTGVDTTSVSPLGYNTCGCKRSSSSAVLGGFTSVGASGNDIPVIQLFAAKDECHGRESSASVAAGRTQQPFVSGSLAGTVPSDATINVTVNSTERHHPLQCISFFEATATEDEDVCASEERGCRSGIPTTRHVAASSDLSPRTSGEPVAITEGSGDGFDSGHCSKKAAITGTTAMVYGSFLGVADVSAGPSTASPSTVSTASPYSCSGFSSSYSLPSSSTSVPDSQLCASAPAATVSPSPTDARLEDGLFTSGSSPCATAGVGSFFTPFSAEGSLSFSLCPSAVPSHEDRTSPSTLPTDKAAREATTESAPAGTGTPNAAGSEKAPVPCCTSFGNQGVATVGVGADHASRAAAAGNRNPTATANATVSPEAVAEAVDHRDFGDAPDAPSGKDALSSRSAVWGATVARTAGEGPQGVIDCAASPRVGRAGSSVSEGEQKESSARPRAAWRAAVRKMFSSKGLLRWKSVITTAVCRPSGVTQPAVNREVPVTAEKQEQLPPPDAGAAAADRRLGLSPHSFPVAAFGPVSVPGGTSRGCDAADIAALYSKYTEEKSPCERKLLTRPCVDPGSKIQSNYLKTDSRSMRYAKGGMIPERHLALITHDLEKQQQKGGRQSDLPQEGRQETLSGEQCNGRQVCRIRYSFKEAQQQMSQQQHNRKQQVWLQHQDEEAQREESVCEAGAAEEATQVSGSDVNVEEGGGRREATECGEGDVRDEETERVKKSFSASSGWMPLSRLREVGQSRSREPHQSEEREEQARQQLENPVAQVRVVVTEHLQTKQCSQAGGSPSHVSQHQWHHQVPETKVQQFSGATEQCKMQHERHKQLLLVVQQQQQLERPRDVAGVCTQDGGHQGRLLAGREVSQREMTETARDCRDEGLRQEVANGAGLQQQRRTQPLQQDQLGGTQAGHRGLNIDDRHLAEKWNLPVEGGGNAHVTEEPGADLSAEAAGENQALPHRTEKCESPALSSSLCFPLSLFPPPGRSTSPGASLGNTTTLLPSAGQLRDWRYRHGPAPGGAAAAAAPAAHFEGPRCTSAAARLVAGDAEQGKRHRATATARALCSADETALPALLATAVPADSSRAAATVAPEDAGAGGIGHPSVSEAGDQLLERHIYPMPWLSGTGSYSCAAVLPTKSNRDGNLDASSFNATQEIFLPPCGSDSPGAFVSYPLCAARQTTGGTENGSCRGCPQAGQDLQQKLPFLECCRSGCSGCGITCGTGKRQQQLRRSLPHARPSYQPPWSTLAVHDSTVARIKAAAGVRSGCSACPTDHVNAEQHMLQRHAKSASAAVTAASTTVAAAGATTWTETAEATVYSASVSPAALGQARSLSATPATTAQKDPHNGAVGEDAGTGPRAAGTIHREAPFNVNTLKREKELTALAFIRDHLTDLTPRRRRYTGETTTSQQGCCPASEWDCSQCERGMCWARPSCVCGALCVCNPADDGAAIAGLTVSTTAPPDTDPADEADSPIVPVQVRALIGERAAAYCVAAQGAQAGFLPQRPISRLHVPFTPTPCPQIAAAEFSSSQRSGAGATEEKQQAVDVTGDSLENAKQRVPERLGVRDSRLQHHKSRFLQLEADDQQLHSHNSSDYLGLATSATGSSRAEGQHHRDKNTDTLDAAEEKRGTTSDRSPQQEGRGAAEVLGVRQEERGKASHVRQYSFEQRIAGEISSPRPCLLSACATARSSPQESCACSGDNSEESGHPCVCALLATGEVGVLRPEEQLFRRYRNKSSTVPLIILPLRLRECAGERAANIAAAEDTTAWRSYRSVSASASKFVKKCSPAAATSVANIPTSAKYCSAVAPTTTASAATPSCTSAAAPASLFTVLSGNRAASAPSSIGNHLLRGGQLSSSRNSIRRAWTIDVAAASQSAARTLVDPFDSTRGRLLGRSCQTATRRSKTAVPLPASLTKSTTAHPIARDSGAPGAACTGRIVAGVGQAGRVTEVAAREDDFRKRKVPPDRDCSHGRLPSEQHRQLEKDDLRQREQLRKADLHRIGTQTKSKRNRGIETHRHPEQQLNWRKQEAAAAAENVVCRMERAVFKESREQARVETSVRAGHTGESCGASTCGAAELRPCLLPPTKVEERYGQQLDNVFSFRLLIVGAALLLLQIVHLVWGVERTRYVSGSNHKEDPWWGVAAAGDAIQLGVYVVLSLGGHIYSSRISLETWTCALFSLAFAIRCCTLLATLFLGRGAFQFPFAPGDVSTAQDAARLASHSGAVSYQLVRLSLCCIFHVLLSGMILRTRTLVCLPMHAIHFGGCLIAVGVAATYTPLDLNPGGPVCALSSCLYTVLGCFCQAQLEASQRQLYVQWKSSLRGLQDMQKKRGHRSPSGTGLTGIEQVALLVRQSQVLLRDVVGRNGVYSKEGVFEQLASLQKQILEIVTDVRSMYHAQTGEEEIQELLNFVPDGHDVELPAVARIRVQIDRHPCRQPTSNDRGCCMWLQNEPLPTKKAAQSCFRKGTKVLYAAADEASRRVGGPTAAPGDGVLDEAVTQKAVVSEGAALDESRIQTTARRTEASLLHIFDGFQVAAVGDEGADCGSSGRPGVFPCSKCAHRFLFEANLDDKSVLRDTAQGLPKATYEKERGDVRQEPRNVAVELICRLGIEWDVDFFQMNEYTKGNSLRLTGEVQLSPLVRPDGLRCQRRVIRRFLHSVQRQYRETNPYHNQLHAAMVSHCCLVLVGECLPSRDALTYTDEICLCVAALTHDMGHPGLTNQYLISSQSLLATTYNDIAVLENYHAACCFRTASHSEELNIFAGLSQEIYSYMRQNIIGLILATDMSKHISYISRLRIRLEAGNFNPAVGADRWLFFQACMKAADLGHLATDWEQHQRWAELLCEEFYRQGDEERRQGLPVVETFDRHMSSRFSQSQFRFIQVVVMPLFEALVDVEMLLKGRGGIRTTIFRHLANNRRRWKKLAIAAGFACATEGDDEGADEYEEDVEQQTTGAKSLAREENGVCNAGERWVGGKAEAGEV